MKIILDNKFLRVFYKPGTGNTTLISFSGIDFDIFGLNNVNPEALDKPEFVHIPDGVGDRFWVVDKERLWGNSIDWIYLVSFLSDYLTNKQVVCLGSCMGAHNAIKFSSYATVDRVISFTPHWSVHPDEIDTEIFDMRTRRLRERSIKLMTNKSLTGMFDPKTEYLNLWAPDVADIPHMLAFPNLPNIERIYFPTSTHSIARMLLRHGILYDVIDEMIIAKEPHKKIAMLCERAGVPHELL